MNFFILFIIFFSYFSRPISPYTSLYSPRGCVSLPPSSGLSPVREEQPTRWQSLPWRAAVGDKPLYLLAKLPPPLSSAYSLVANVVSFLQMNHNFLRLITEKYSANCRHVKRAFFIAFDSKALLSTK